MIKFEHDGVGLPAKARMISEVVEHVGALLLDQLVLSGTHARTAYISAVFCELIFRTKMPTYLAVAKRDIGGRFARLHR